MGVKLSTDCKKTATENGNLQPEIEINEYSSSKKSTRVVYYSSSTRVLAATLTATSDGQTDRHRTTAYIASHIGVAHAWCDNDIQPAISAVVFDRQHCRLSRWPDSRQGISNEGENIQLLLLELIFMIARLLSQYRLQT